MDEARLDIGGHLLCAGWITTTVVAGRREKSILPHSRHKGIPIIRSYIQSAQNWDDHAGDGLL